MILEYSTGITPKSRLTDSGSESGNSRPDPALETRILGPMASPAFAGRSARHLPDRSGLRFLRTGDEAFQQTFHPRHALAEVGIVSAEFLAEVGIVSAEFLA